MTYDNGTAWNIGRAINIMLYEDSDDFTDNRFTLMVVLDGYVGTCADGTEPTDLDGPTGSRATGNALSNQAFKDLNLDDSLWPQSIIPVSTAWYRAQRRCRLAFRLSNIEPGRNLRDETDLSTFLDDPTEYTAIIGSDESLVGRASWQGPIDGLVIPLRIDNTTLSPVRLRDYTWGDPIFELIFWDTLNAWNIRSLNTTSNMIEFRRTPFATPPAGENLAIRLNISQSRSCS